MTTLDELRLAAKRYARADDEHTKLVQFGAHASAAVALETLKGATRELVKASDLHAAREHEGIADLIRSGHTYESALRVKKLRADPTAAPVKRKRRGPGVLLSHPDALSYPEALDRNSITEAECQYRSSHGGREFGAAVVWRSPFDPVMDHPEAIA